MKRFLIFLTISSVVCAFDDFFRLNKSDQWTSQQISHDRSALIIDLVGKWNSKAPESGYQTGNFKGVSLQDHHSNFYGFTISNYKGKYINDSRKLQIGGWEGYSQKQAWNFSKQVSQMITTIQDIARQEEIEKMQGEYPPYSFQNNPRYDPLVYKNQQDLQRNLIATGASNPVSPGNVIEIVTPTGIEIVQVKQDQFKQTHFDQTFHDVQANLTDFENYFPGQVKSCLLDIHLQKEDDSPRIQLKITESTVHQGFCLSKGDQILINMHRQTYEDYDKYLNQVWIFCIIFTFFILLVLNQTLKEKERVYDSLHQRQNFGQMNNYGAQTSMITATINVIWIYLFFAIMFEMASNIKAYFYLFVLPMVSLGITIAFQFISLVTTAQIHALNASEHENDQKKYFIRFIVGMCLTYALLDFFIMEILLKHDHILMVFGGGIWLPQIYRNAVNVKRKAPEAYYISAMQAMQTFFILYVKVYPYNILQNRPTSQFGWIYIAIIAVQMIILALQKKVHPRFFLPKSCRRLSGGYEYKKAFDEKDQESLDIDFDQETCAICLGQLREMPQATEQNQLLESHRASAGSFADEQRQKDLEQPILSASQFVQTPCGHSFHKKCLYASMKYKMDCPNCRQNLPPPLTTYSSFNSDHY